MSEPLAYTFRGLQLTFEITLGNVAVAITVFGAIFHFGRKMLKRMDLFIRMGADYYIRTGNNMARDVYEEFVKIYGESQRKYKEKEKEP